MTEVSNPSPSSSSAPPPTQLTPKLPATFDRWFWTPEYRRGVVTLFTKLNAGLRESQELIAFIRKRESFERAYAHELRNPNPIDPLGFGYDDGASFSSVYKQLCSSQIDLADAHVNLARQLDRLVIGPFEVWSRAHQERVTKAIDKVESILIRWEKQAKEVIKLKQVYDSKTREADDAEEDSRFSPAGGSIYTHQESSTNGQPSNHRQHPTASNETYGQISKMVSEQTIGLSRAVSQKMRIRDGRVGFMAQSLKVESENQSGSIDEKSLLESSITEEKPLPKSPTAADADLPASAQVTEKRATYNSQPAGTTLLNIAGVIKPPIQWSQLFQKAHDTIFKQNVKVPLLGTYQGAHSGEDLVIFFASNLQELNGNSDRAIELCRELSQQLSVLRLIGEIGNKFIATQDAFYVWKPEAFSLHELSSDTGFGETLTELPERRHFKSSSQSQSPFGLQHSTRTPNSASQNPNINSFDNLNTRNSGTGAVLSKYLQTAVTQAAKGINELSATVGVSTVTTSLEPSGASRAERLRREAQSAEKAYSSCVIRLDHTRLMLEQTISEYFQFLQRCELDRLRAAKAVIMGFNAALATLNPKMTKLAEEAVVLNESFSPEGDVAALVERYRTGPFRPSPILFHSYRFQDTRVNFGIDLSKWHNAQQVENCEDFQDVPPVLTRLLNHLEKSYKKITSDEERRRTWIYEVRLKTVHGLREAMNDPYKSSISDEELDALDAPLLAATVKLWLLELDPPPVHYSKYDDIKAIYPQRVGIEAPSVDTRVDVLATLLSKLPRPHLMVIDAIVSHLRNLFISTDKESEDDKIYLTKIGLSFSRTLLRPKVENAMTLSDRFQPLFLADLIQHYEQILPVAIGLRNKMLESDIGSKKPERKNTRPIDLRVRRSDLGIEGSVSDSKAQEILENQRRRVSNVELPDPHKKSPPAASSTPPESTIEGSSLSATSVLPVEDQRNLNDQKVEEKDTEDGKITAPGSNLVTDETQAIQEPTISDKEFIESTENFDEASDPPFVMPSEGLDELVDELVDMPFVPPTEESLVSNNQIGQPYAITSEIDEEDIPLSTKANLNRISSRDRPQSSLNRKRGVIASPKVRSNSSAKLNQFNATVSTGSTSAGSNPSPLPDTHKKSSPSVGSLRSQFESSSSVNNLTSKRDSHNPVAESLPANRYRKSPGPGKV